MHLKGGVIGGHSHEIFLARLKNAGTELVESRIILRCLNLIDKLPVVEGNYIRLSGGILAGLEDVDIEWYISIGHVQNKIDQLRLFLAEGESEPLESFEHCGVTILG